MDKCHVDIITDVENLIYCDYLINAIDYTVHGAIWDLFEQSKAGASAVESKPLSIWIVRRGLRCVIDGRCVSNVIHFVQAIVRHVYSTQIQPNIDYGGQHHIVIMHTQQYTGEHKGLS